MSRWWRAYDEAVDDPKLCLLTDKQHRAWFNLCCITSQNGGKLPLMTAVAFKLRMTVDKARAIVAELVALGLVDVDEVGIASPHNWNARQYKSDTSNDRVAAFRKRQRNGECNVTETVDVTPPEYRAEAEQITEKIPEPNGSGPTQVDLEKQLFSRGRQVCGKASGGLIASLLKAKQHDVALARAVIETAATKQDPREYVAAATRSKANGQHRSPTMDAFDDLIARTGGTVEGDPPMRDVTPRGGHVG